MKIVSLPSGRLINIESVAWASARGPSADELKEGRKLGTLKVFFAAVHDTGKGSVAMHVELGPSDAEAFLKALSQDGIDVSNTRTALTSPSCHSDEN